MNFLLPHVDEPVVKKTAAKRVAEANGQGPPLNLMQRRALHTSAA